MSSDNQTSRQGAPSPRLMSSAELRRLPAGETFKGILIVNSINKKTDKNGRIYRDMTVSDEHGSISAKVWSDAGWWDRSSSEPDAKPGMLSDDQIASLKGKTVGVTGKTVDYRGQVQFNFNAISLLDQERYPPSRFMASSDIPLPVLSQRFDDLVEQCRPEIRDFLRAVYSGDRERLFRLLPAAVSNHHAYAHGLLEHTVTVAESARAIARSYAGIYPTLDVDLVVAGALLHDLGKLESYSIAPTPEVTIAGAVIDHIPIGYAMFERIARESGLSDDLRLHLGHILLSHHGQKEFGSPILPATLEAMIVSSADELDFRLCCWRDSVKDLAEDQEITAFHYIAQRRFWKNPTSGRGESDD